MFQRYGIATHSESTQSPLSLQASVFAIFLCVLFGANAVAIKFTLTGLCTFTAAAVRFNIAVVAIFLWTRFTHQSIRFRKGQAHQLLIISVLFVAQISLFYVGLSKTFASRGALIVNFVPFLYICAFLFDKPMMNAPGGGVVAAILYQGLITGSFGFVAWNVLLQRYGAVSLHTFIFIMPVVGVLLGGLLLKEPITGNILIALVLIGTGIFVTQFHKKTDYSSDPEK